MIDSDDTESLSFEAEVKEGSTFSRIWILPILALSIGLWMLYAQWSDQGPLVSITFESAAGVEAGKTTIKTRDVVIGEVEAIALQKDNDGVTV
jgi:paraquat-inducible protein B